MSDSRCAARKTAHVNIKIQTLALFFCTESPARSVESFPTATVESYSSVSTIVLYHSESQLLTDSKLLSLSKILKYMKIEDVRKFHINFFERLMPLYLIFTNIFAILSMKIRNLTIY